MVYRAAISLPEGASQSEAATYMDRIRRPVAERGEPVAERSRSQRWYREIGPFDSAQRPPFGFPHRDRPSAVKENSTWHGLPLTWIMRGSDHANPVHDAGEHHVPGWRRGESELSSNGFRLRELTELLRGKRSFCVDTAYPARRCGRYGQ